MKLIIQITILLLIVSCREELSFNPFDAEFDVSVGNPFENEKYNIVPACSSINVVKKGTGSFKPYYQLFQDDYYYVSAKGFTYKMDTLSLDEYDSFPSLQDSIYENSILRDSIFKLPIDEKKINSELLKFNYEILDRYEYEKTYAIRIVNQEIKDTILLDIEISFDNKKHLAIRRINYYNSNPERPIEDNFIEKKVNAIKEKMIMLLTD